MTKTSTCRRKASRKAANQSPCVPFSFLKRFVQDQKRQQHSTPCCATPIPVRQKMHGERPRLCTLDKTYPSQRESNTSLLDFSRRAVDQEYISHFRVFDSLSNGFRQWIALFWRSVRPSVAPGSFQQSPLPACFSVSILFRKYVSFNCPSFNGMLIVIDDAAQISDEQETSLFFVVVETDTASLYILCLLECEVYLDADFAFSSSSILIEHLDMAGVRLAENTEGLSERDSYTFCVVGAHVQAINGGGLYAGLFTMVMVTYVSLLIPKPRRETNLCNHCEKAGT